MTREDHENIVKLLPDEALVCILISNEADMLVDCPPDFHENIEIALHGKPGIGQMSQEQLQKAVVDWLVEYYEEDDEVDGEAVAELIDEQVKDGRTWVDAIAKIRKERESAS